MYQASKARLNPLLSVALSDCSGNIVGTLESTHDVGADTSMEFFVFSKSSIYEALSCTPPACPAINCANSPVKEICDGCVQCRKGSLLSISVSHWLSFFQLMFKPQRVLLSGSEPMLTFVVRACSDRCCIVPLSWKSFEKSYCQLSPSIVFRSCA